MKALMCELCGSNEIIKQNGYYVCQHCGTKYTVEDARNLIIDGPLTIEGTVQIDLSKELSNLYELARRAKESCNFEKAQKYYDQILEKDTNSWEANFYSAYYQNLNEKAINPNELVSFFRLKECVKTVLKLIKDGVLDVDERKRAISEVAGDLIGIANIKCAMAENKFKQQMNYSDYQLHASVVLASKDILYFYGDEVVNLFGRETGKDAAILCWKEGVKLQNGILCKLKDKDTNSNEIIAYCNKIKEYDETYIAPTINNTSTGGGCYIATAVYGSYNSPQVWTLRRYRDNTLAESWYGRVFIRVYYAISPTLVKWFGKAKWFHSLWKPILDQIVSHLNEKGYVDTPYGEKQ